MLKHLCGHNDWAWTEGEGLSAWEQEFQRWLGKLRTGLLFAPLGNLMTVIASKVRLS